ncbi:MAG: hypothetical protein EOP48_03060 [Sphingobacteriales bacterium]|nr:MAG: hypothetical protein EOP48_03060 [Sphingobacteriales bacterium]
MKKFLTIGIDVEPDCSADWSYSNPLSFRGMHEGIGKILHPLFGRYDIKPTYLMNNVVMEDPGSVELMKNLPGQFELGTHLHPEFIEPERQFSDYAGKSARRNCCFYPPEIEREKLVNITRLFEKSFGHKPTSFRAGRFSAGPNTIQSLRELGYKIDTSVTPHIKWSDSTREQPVDFLSAPEQPYFIKEGTITGEAGEKEGLLQVPVTIGLLKRNPIQELAASGLGLRRKINWNRRIWLRPAFSRFQDMKALIDLYSRRYADREAIVFNMMFHNVEVLPGLSPYTSSQESCDSYLKDLENFFEFCNMQQISSIGLSDTYPLFTEKPVIQMQTTARSNVINMIS